MNRRSFLGTLLAGAATAAVAIYEPMHLGFPELHPWNNYDPILEQEIPINAVIGEYADYTSFSSFSIANAIDESVSNAARELSYQCGKSVSMLYDQSR